MSATKLLCGKARERKLTNHLPDCIRKVEGVEVLLCSASGHADILGLCARTVPRNVRSQWPGSAFAESFPSTLPRSAA
eukprot:1990422-Amphidinium_carterae.1